MDIIDNYNRLTIGQHMEIRDITMNESLEDIDKQVQILSILTGVAEDELLHLPISEYKELVVKAGFLNPENIKSLSVHQVAKKYIVGGFELVPIRDYRKLETGQYIDFQTYAPDLDKNLVEFLSVILVPKGHRYNEGYDILEVQQAIREEMSVTDGVSLAGFFLTWCRQSILDSLNYSRKEAMKIKDKKERERILERIREEEIRLQPNGDGSQMSMQSPRPADAPGTK
jgi:hypothetical protein